MANPNQSSFLNDSPDYFFNPYDSDSYPESEDIYQVPNSDTIRSNIESVIINNESPLQGRPTDYIEIFSFSCT